MELSFRKLTAGPPPAPAPGELYLLPPSPVPQKSRGVALQVLEQGLTGFPRGPGRVEKIILDGAATFDDLLAAAFASYLLAGQPLPEGCQAFARYASLGRQGLRPSHLPFEHSLEGLFLACRADAGEDLTDPATARRFTTYWSRIAERILAAAGAGVDPVTTPLGANEPEFDPALRLLARDRQRYRQDVARGERWLVRLPGEQAPAAGLLLREPTSTFFQHWSRADPDTPSGEPYRLLTVQGGRGRWLCCVDPQSAVSLEPLAEKLQAAEGAQQPTAAPDRRWSVGETADPAVIFSSPAGTALADEQVLEVIRQWASAKVYRRPRFRPGKKLMLGAAAGLVVVLLVWFLWGGRGSRFRGFIPDTGPTPAVVTPRNLRVLAVGVSTYRESQYNLDAASNDARDLAAALTEQQGLLFQKVLPTVLSDQAATRKAILDALSGLKTQVSAEDLVVVALAGHGENLEQEAQFYFLPYDVDASSLASSGIPWSQVRELLGGLPCPVFVVLDTCHSGTATRGLSGRDVATGGKTRSALIVLAACLSGGQAQERAEWGHGALTLALLEAIEGRRLYGQKTGTELPRPNSLGEITLADLTCYVEKRFAELVGSAQAVVANNSGNVALNQIPVARRRTGGVAAAQP